MTDTGHKYLLFVTKPYSFSILEPIAQHIISENQGDVVWFNSSKERKNIPAGNYLISSNEVMEYHPDAVLVPGNIVPGNWPGIKVQLFHGMDDEVKGYYNINGQFDLYCTHGGESTKRFDQLSKKLKYFMVRETGWPKLDPLFDNIHSKLNSRIKLIKEIGFDENKPILLYAPTFPLKYTSAYDLFREIAKLKAQYQWLIKFHTLMDKKIQNQYCGLTSESFKIIGENNILPYFNISNILITDTSSVAYEFLPLNRPIITYKAIARKDKGINILDPMDLHGTIIRSLLDPKEFAENRKYYLNEIHPYFDGKSSERVLIEVQNFIDNKKINALRRKPYNIIRNCKARMMVN